MQINQYAKATGLSPRAIRLYEEKGLITSHRQTGNNYRIYQANQVAIGIKIRKNEELQLLASAYAKLFLGAAAQQSMKEFAADHRLISKCLKKIGESRLSDRHLRLAQAYSKMK